MLYVGRHTLNQDKATNKSEEIRKNVTLTLREERMSHDYVIG